MNGIKIRKGIRYRCYVSLGRVDGFKSTFNAESATNVANKASASIKVHCYVVQSDEQSRQDARKHGVNLITAQSIPGSVHWIG